MIKINIELVKLALATLIAFFALALTAGQQIDLENLARGDQNTSRIEYYDGLPFTAYNPKDIKSLLDEQETNPSSLIQKSPCFSVLWLGNSQLHYINEYQAGDHLAPYWLRSLWNKTPCIMPLGCSLPNADLQEFLVLSRYLTKKSPMHLLILELVFDDLREDAVRSDFSVLLSPDTLKRIRKTSPTAATILARYKPDTNETGSELDEDVLSGTVQRPIERWLNSKLTNAWKLWASRPQIEGNLFLGLYNLRNYLLRINPSSVRKMISARYDVNMAALKDILSDYRERKIPVLLYIAPICQDKPIPYDPKEYVRWKEELAVLSQQFDAHLVNLETLVPEDQWGSYYAKDVDFMHFKGPAHRKVAEALTPYIQNILGASEK
jgi:hypothetical protein